MLIVAMGEIHSGTWYPKPPKTMKVPRTRTEYIAPFFRNAYFLTLSKLLIVSCLTTRAPIPLPISMSGTDKVKAKAPTTPSTKNVASMTSKYIILLQSVKFREPFLDKSSFSFSSAFCLKPCTMKNAVEPTTAPNARSASLWMAYHVIMVSRTETTAKNHAPCEWKNFSPFKPYFLGSMKSQWKNKNTRKTPPPINRIGVELCTDCWTSSSLLKVAVSAPHKPSDGFAAHTKSKGSRPRMTNTATSSPHTRHQRLASSDMVESTSAFMTALSMPVIISNTARPMTVRMRKNNSTINYP